MSAVSACVHACMCACMRMYMCACVRVYVCICVCACEGAEREAEGPRVSWPVCGDQKMTLGSQFSYSSLLKQGLEPPFILL